MSSHRTAEMWLSENQKKPEIIKKVYKEVKKILSKSTTEQAKYQIIPRRVANQAGNKLIQLEEAKKPAGKR